MNLSFEDASNWLKSNVKIKDVLDANGGIKCGKSEKYGCAKLVHGDTNTKGIYTFKCMSPSCGISGSSIDMYMHLTKIDFKTAVEEMCIRYSINIQNEVRYETKKNSAGWQEWPWYTPEKKLQHIKKRNKTLGPNGVGGQGRPATTEEIALGFALKEPLEYLLDPEGQKIPVDIDLSPAEPYEESLGYHLKKAPLPHAPSSGHNAGRPYKVRFNPFYKVHMVDCLGKRYVFEWPYLADKWHAKASEDILIVEGEKDADVLGPIGYLATTSGASSVAWTVTQAEKLAGRKRYHFRDNDIPGAKSFIPRLETFSFVDGEDYWVRIPDHKKLKESKGEDIRDYLANHSNEELKEIVAAALPVTDDLLEQLKTELKTAQQKVIDERQELKTAPDATKKPSKIKVIKPPVDPDEDKYNKDKEPFFRPTETGNGLRLKYRYGHKIRSCMKGFESEFLIWNGHKWKTDIKNKKAFLLTQEVSEMIRREVKVRDANTDEKDKPGQAYIEKLRRWSNTTESVSNRRNTLESCAAEPELLTEHEDFDQNHYLVNCQNGTIDMKTGLFRPAKKSDLITKSLNTVFDSNAKCPQFKEFLSFIMMGDQELVRYLQRLFGYILTGLTREECMHMFIGSGQNGKGVLMELIGWMMGDYSLTAEADMFLLKRSEAAASSDIARLMGSRLVLASETNEGATFNEAKLKSLCSRDRLTARYNHANPFSFYPTHKLLLATNKKIRVTGKDRGIWRRIRVINFLRDVSNEDCDKDLQEKLRKESSGILNWIIEGFQQYQQLDGLKPPKKVTDWIEDYKESMDYLAEFFEKYCIIATEENEDKKDLFNAFYNWQKDDLKEAKPYNYNAFSRIMEQHQYKETRARDGELDKNGKRKLGKRKWSGLRLKTADEIRTQDLLEDHIGRTEESANFRNEVATSEPPF